MNCLGIPLTRNPQSHSIGVDVCTSIHRCMHVSIQAHTVSPGHIHTRGPTHLLTPSSAHFITQAMNKSNNRMGVIALASLMGLFIVKRKLFGGGGGSSSRGRGRGGDDTEEYSSGRRGRPAARPSSSMVELAEKLMVNTTVAERAALKHVSVCNEELRKAQHNQELLRDDWRIGSIRLVNPVSGPYPPGYEQVDMQKCSLERFLQNLDHQHLMASAGIGPGVPAPPLTSTAALAIAGQISS